MREGIAISTMSEKERVYHTGLIETFVEADRAIDELKAAVDIRRIIKGGITVQEAMEAGREFLKPYQNKDYPEIIFASDYFLDINRCSARSFPEGYTTVSSGWYRLFYRAEQGLFTEDEYMKIRLAFMMALSHENAHHEFRFLMKSHIFPDSLKRLKTYISECFADVRAAQMMCFKPPKAADIYRFKTEEIYKRNVTDRDYLRHPSDAFRIQVLENGRFDEDVIHDIALRVGATYMEERLVIEEMHDFERRHPGIVLDIEL